MQLLQSNKGALVIILQHSLQGTNTARVITAMDNKLNKKREW